MQNIKKSLKQTLMWFKELLPMLLGILLLISMFNQLWVFNYLNDYLSNDLISVFLADIFWSILAWSTINSYVIANSFWDINNNMLVITVFLISWITVWIIQIPAEIYFFGKKFALIRNWIAFIFAIIATYLIYFLMIL